MAIDHDDGEAATPPAGRPALVVVETAVDQAHRDDLAERRAWTKLAAATDEALIDLGPRHPQRADFLEMRADCLRAAQQPLAPSLRLTA